MSERKIPDDAYFYDFLRHVFDSLPREKQAAFWMYVDSKNFLLKRHPTPREVNEAYNGKQTCFEIPFLIHDNLTINFATIRNENVIEKKWFLITLES